MAPRPFERLEPSLARRVAALKALPADSPLEGDAAVRFATARLRIWRRYDGWRRNLPTIEGLFDDEADGARAIAGNLATEGSAIASAWLAACPADLVSESDRVAWVAGFLDIWTLAATEAIREADWGEDARNVFGKVLGELVERARSSAAEQVLASSRLPGHRRVGLPRRVASSAGRALLRIFDPARFD